MKSKSILSDNFERATRTLAKNESSLTPTETELIIKLARKFNPYVHL